jgi:uncharacterized protein YkuJ
MVVGHIKEKSKSIGDDLTLKRVRITRKGGGGAETAPQCEICFSDCFCQFVPYHPSNVYTMKVHVAWEHSSFKNVDLVAIQSFETQAQIFNLSIFGKI